MARAGLLDVARDSGGYCFTFQDVVLLRGAAELESADLPARRVRSALRRLREQLPGRPLSAVHVGTAGGRVIAREASSAWEPLTGQYVLLLEGAAPGASKESGDVTALDRRPHEGGSLRAGERGPDDWFELGLELESTSPDEARRAYARTLELRPDHPDAHFNLSRLYEDTGDRAAALRHLRSYSQLTRTS